MRQRSLSWPFSIATGARSILKGGDRREPSVTTTSCTALPRVSTSATIDREAGVDLASRQWHDLIRDFRSTQPSCGSSSPLFQSVTSLRAYTCALGANVYRHTIFDSETDLPLTSAPLSTTRCESYAANGSWHFATRLAQRLTTADTFQPMATSETIAVERSCITLLPELSDGHARQCYQHRRKDMEAGHLSMETSDPFAESAGCGGPDHHQRGRAALSDIQ